MNAARAVILALLLGWAFTARADVVVPPLSAEEAKTICDEWGSITEMLTLIDPKAARLAARAAAAACPLAHP